MIEAEDNVATKVKLYGQDSTYYGGELDDYIANYGRNYQIRGEGDDTFYINGKVSQIGDTSGNNIYYINADNCSFSGGQEMILV